MVYAGIPNHYTGSPSSYVAPSLTINHEATVDLDSTNAFEGEIRLIFVVGTADYMSRA